MKAIRGILENEDSFRDNFWESAALELIWTGSPEMQTVYDRIRSVAPTRSTILLLGETGTGKSVLARFIHDNSNRKAGRFVAVHCGAIPDTLVESELFGHERGAFTGASHRRQGKFQMAHNGTIFLDEVGTLTPSAQIKLLQVLQDGTLQRVGSEATLQVDARIIAATNGNLQEMCREGKFREDLYYRLHVFPIEVPPLHRRKADIPHLANLFLQRLNMAGEKEVQAISPDVLEAFDRYPWPGNIRELENVIERAYVSCTGGRLLAEDFPEEITGPGAGGGGPAQNEPLTLSQVRRRAVEVSEGWYLREMLTAHQGSVRDTAQALGISPRQLNKLMDKHTLQKKDFKPPASIPGKPRS